MKNGTNDEKRKNYVVVFCKLDPLVKAKGKMCFSSRTHQLALLKARKKVVFVAVSPYNNNKKRESFQQLESFGKSEKKKQPID